jgi:hypothetical protein
MVDRTNESTVLSEALLISRPNLGTGRTIDMDAGRRCALSVLSEDHRPCDFGGSLPTQDPSLLHSQLKSPAYDKMQHRLHY